MLTRDLFDAQDEVLTSFRRHDIRYSPNLQCKRCILREFLSGVLSSKGPGPCSDATAGAVAEDVPDTTPPAATSATVYYKTGSIRKQHQSLHKQPLQQQQHLNKTRAK